MILVWVQSKYFFSAFFWPIKSKISQFLTFAEDLSIASWPAVSCSCRFCLAGYPGYPDIDAKNEKSSDDEYKIGTNSSNHLPTFKRHATLSITFWNCCKIGFVCLLQFQCV